MNAKRKSTGQRRAAATDRVGVRRVGPGDVYELVYPRAVAQRADDMEEVRRMMAAGEIDVAEDELRWLVGGCDALLEGHKLLGQIAAGDKNWELARAHLGHAYQLGLDAAKSIGPRGMLPHEREANRNLHAAGLDLAKCLLAQGEEGLARQVVDQLLAWDPSDPLGVKDLENA